MLITFTSINSFLPTNVFSGVSYVYYYGEELMAYTSSSNHVGNGTEGGTDPMPTYQHLGLCWPT